MNKKPITDLVRAKNEIAQMWAIPRTDLVSPPPHVQQNQNAGQQNAEMIRAMLSQQNVDIDDAEQQMLLLPDLNLVEEIIVATTLSPKDLTDAELNITLPLGSPEGIAEIIKTHFTTEYNLLALFPTILKQAWFRKGRYVLMTLPVASIRHMMQTYNTILTAGVKQNHIAVESFINNMRLGSSGIFDSDINNELSFGLEDLNGKEIVVDKKKTTIDSTNYITISDNALHIMTNHVSEHIRQTNTNNALHDYYGFGLELATESSKPIPLNGKTYYDSHTAFSNYVKLQNVSPEQSELNAIVINIPPEAISPIFLPGSPEVHIAYLVALDEFGGFLKPVDDSNRYRNMNTRLNQTVAYNAQIFNPITGQSSQGGYNNPRKVEEMGSFELAQFTKPIIDIYINEFEEKLKRAIGKNANSSNIEIGQSEELYRLMFFRQLEKQQTRIVYVPKELITYFAFEYDKLGQGVSALKKTKLYSGFRATLLFSNIMSAIRNSITSSTLNITLSDTDTDPSDTIEKAINVFAAMQPSRLPTMTSFNAADIVDSIVRAGTNVTVEGGKGWPATKFDITERQRTIAKPDTDTQDLLRMNQYSGIGASPEQIDKSFESDFATGIEENNLLTAKRTLVRQNIFTGHLSSFIQTYIMGGGDIFKRIKEAYDASASKDLTLLEVINGIKVVLPKPDSAVVTAQYEAYKKYSDFINEVIPTYISDEMIRNSLKGENLPDAITVVKESISALMKRNYLRRHNMLPELDDLLVNTETSLADTIENHQEAIINVITDIVKNIKIKESKADADIGKVVSKLAPPEDKAADGATADTGQDTPTDPNNMDTPDDGLDELSADDTATPDEGADSGSEEPVDDNAEPKAEEEATPDTEPKDEPVVDEKSTEEEPVKDEESVVEEDVVEKDKKDKPIKKK